MGTKKGAKPKVKLKKKAKRKVAKNATIRQRRVAKLLAEKGRTSVSKAMREAGYSKSTATKPSKVTKSKAWPALMDEYFPQDFVAKKHKELFDAKHSTFMRKNNKIIEKKYPDNAARKAAVDMAYKLRGSFAAEKVEVQRRKFGDMSDAELAETIKGAKKVLLKK